MNPRRIKENDITNVEPFLSHCEACRSYAALVEAYTSSIDLMTSDGDLSINRTLVTTNGAFMTSRVVIDALRNRSLEKAAEKATRIVGAEELERKKFERDKLAFEKTEEMKEKSVSK